MMLREKIIRFCLLLLRLGMGGFFLFVAVRKLLHLDQLQETIDRFSIFPEAWGHPLACLGVSCEIAVGMGLLFRRTCAGAALLGSALTCCSSRAGPGGFPSRATASAWRGW
mgnify:CR=1 FL=1